MGPSQDRRKTVSSPKLFHAWRSGSSAMRLLALAAAVTLLASGQDAIPARLSAWSVEVLPSGAENLSASTAASTNPVAVATGESIMVVWEEEGTLRYALRSGGRWKPAAPVPAAWGTQPALTTAADGTFELVWSSVIEDGGQGEILHSRFADDTWSLPELVAETPGDSLRPKVAADPQGNLLVVWIERQDGHSSIYAATSGPELAWTFGPLGTRSAVGLALAYGDEAWHIAFSTDVDGDGLDDILYCRSGLPGWGADEVVTRGDAEAAHPAIAVDGAGRPAIAWVADRRTVRYGQKLAGDWTQVAVGDGDPGMAVSPALVFDHADRPFLAWPKGSQVPMTRPEGNDWPAPSLALQFGHRASHAALVRYDLGYGLIAAGSESESGSDIYYLDLGPEGWPRAPTPGAGPSATLPEPSTPPADLTPTPEASVVASPTSTANAVWPTITPPSSPTPMPWRGSWHLYLPIGYR